MIYLLFHIHEYNIINLLQKIFNIVFHSNDDVPRNESKAWEMFIIDINIK